MAGKLTIRKAKSSSAALPDNAPSAETVSMLAPEGRFVQVPVSDAGTMAAVGFKADTPELRAQMEAEAKYSGLGSEVAAAGLGLASGLTLGVSKPLFRKTGVPVDELEQANPDAYLAGEMGSFLVPGLGEIGALGKAAKAAKGASSALRGVSAVGDIAKEIVAKQLGKGVVAQSAAKFGAEAATYAGVQAGGQILDDWVQNKELTAEALLAHAGSVAGAGLIGAGLGAAFPILQKIGSKALEKAGESGEKFFDPERSRQLFTGAAAKELRDDTGARFQQAVHELGEGGLYKGGSVDLDSSTGRIVQTEKGSLPSTEAVVDRQKNLLEKAGNAMGERLSVADTQATQAGIKPTSAAWSPQDVVDADAKISAWRKSRAISQAEAENMTAVVHDIGAGVQEADGSLRALHNLRRGLDARIGGKNWESLKSEEIEIVKDLRRVVSDKIDQSMSELEREGIVSDGGAWQRLNRLYSNLKTIETPINRAVARANANVNVGGLRWRDMLAGMGGSAVGGAIGGPAGAALGTLTGVANKLMQTDRGLLLRAEIGERLAKLSVGAGKAFTLAAENALKPAAKAAEGEALLGATRLAEEWFSPLQQTLSNVVADPLMAADALHKQTEAVRGADPELADALVQKQMRAYSYLYEKMPKTAAPPFPGDKPKKPSPADLQSFAKIVRTVQDPKTIFADIRAGTASREQVKALQALYPAIYQQLVKTITDALANAKTPVPYQQQVKLGQLLGAPVTNYLRPAFVKRMQSLAPSGLSDSEKQSTGKVQLSSENMMSDSMRVEARNVRDK